jgi:hypothetical protein
MATLYAHFGFLCTSSFLSSTDTQPPINLIPLVNQKSRLPWPLSASLLSNNHRYW